MYEIQHRINRFTVNLRFKRWSRAKYAVFASISSCVSIGRLKATIADCLLRKQENALSENNTVFSLNAEEDSECSETSEQTSLLNNPNLLLTVTEVKPQQICGSDEPLSCSKKSKVDAGQIPSSTFFIVK